jgi:hypothetical protein
MNEIRDNTDQRLPANAPQGSIPGADVTSGTVPLSQNRSPADPSLPQLPPAGETLADVAHPLGKDDGRGNPKSAIETRAAAQSKIEAFHQKAVEMFHEIGPLEGALAGDVKAACLAFERRLATALQYHFGAKAIDPPTSRADAARS